MVIESNDVKMLKIIDYKNIDFERAQKVKYSKNLKI